MQTIEGIETELNMHDNQIATILDIIEIKEIDNEDQHRELQGMLSKQLKIMSGLLDKQGEMADRIIELEKLLKKESDEKANTV